MLVLNLSCACDHGFEAWFGSSSDFESQQASGLIACPVCGNAQIRRLPSAPRLNLSHLRRDSGAAASAALSPPHEAALRDRPLADQADEDRNHRMAEAKPDPTSAQMAMQAQMYQALRQMASKSENVGPRFAEEARRIHYGEAEARSIRGQASHAESEALLEEGIAVLPLPDIPGLNDPLH
ncbi:DUF1178 family protein [Paucibacter sp. DJ2R-2]|uniref:DUF1178 family protein n=1 Tax=Paucibacter sp. DJ2R-2 TaxID=2893558 RepID=UPI0021E39E80|nr:DUF1178 family protein [Paucibacter sp. DJ2R-2]MCV2420543.1 DUF1178 family protein [Paucibacter sp. DJ4R-1]MCV2439721.1 DUF1178 family protein [Paucibacter sp. DJ2R-2]